VTQLPLEASISRSRAWKSRHRMTIVVAYRREYRLTGGMGPLSTVRSGAQTEDAIGFTITVDGVNGSRGDEYRTMRILDSAEAA
jgi:hypothetical protein